MGLQIKIRRILNLLGWGYIIFLVLFYIIDTITDLESLEKGKTKITTACVMLTKPEGPGKTEFAYIYMVQNVIYYGEDSDVLHAGWLDKASGNFLHLIYNIEDPAIHYLNFYNFIDTCSNLGTSIKSFHHPEKLSWWGVITTEKGRKIDKSLVPDVLKENCECK